MKKLLKLLLELGRELDIYLAYLNNVMDALDKKNMKVFYLVMNNDFIRRSIISKRLH